MRRSYSNAATLIVNAVDENEALDALVENGFSDEQIENHARRLNQKLSRLRERLEKNAVNDDIDTIATASQEDFDAALADIVEQGVDICPSTLYDGIHDEQQQENDHG